MMNTDIENALGFAREKRHSESASPDSDREEQSINTWLESIEVSNPAECAQILERNGVDFSTLFVLEEADLEAMFSNRRGYLARIRQAIALATDKKKSSSRGVGKTVATRRSAPVDIQHLDAVHDRYRKILTRMKEEKLPFRQAAILNGVGPQTIRDRRYIAELFIIARDKYNALLVAAQTEDITVAEFEKRCQAEFKKLKNVDFPKLISWGRWGKRPNRSPK
eukprot:Sdes_comp17983_c0_seq1m7245